jgi:hypothetical protein
MAVLQSAGSLSSDCKHHLSVQSRDCLLLISSERESQDIFILWPSYSQPEALLPTASNIFLCSPEITSCSGSSTDKLLKI